MAWYDWVTGKAELKLAEKAGGGIFNKITGNMSAAERRAQQRLISEQINAYKDQTMLARQQLDSTRAQSNTEQRRVDEKQIRALRRNYRAQGAGLLGIGKSATEDMNSKLGG